MAEPAQSMILRNPDFRRWSPTDFMEFIQEVFPGPENQAIVDTIRQLGFDGDIMFQIMKQARAAAILPISQVQYRKLRFAAVRIVDHHKVEQYIFNQLYNHKRNERHEEELRNPNRMSWDARNDQRAADRKRMENVIDYIMSKYERQYDVCLREWLPGEAVPETDFVHFHCRIRDEAMERITPDLEFFARPPPAQPMRLRNPDIRHWSPTNFMEFVRDVFPGPENLTIVDAIRQLGLDGDIMDQIMKETRATAILPISQIQYRKLRLAAIRIVEHQSIRQNFLCHKCDRRRSERHEEELRNPNRMSWDARNDQRAADQQEMEVVVDEAMADVERCYDLCMRQRLHGEADPETDLVLLHRRILLEASAMNRAQAAEIDQQQRAEEAQ